MKPKSFARFSIVRESLTSSTASREFSKAIYTRGVNQPGCYLIRLRMRQPEAQFRPRLRFL